MASGRPDWFGTIVSAGKYDTQMIPIAVDKYGSILALMKGAYDEFLKTIAVDEEGVMKANISVQDLEFLTFRPAYGEARQDSGAVSIPPGTTTSLKSVSGRGIIVAAHIFWVGVAIRKDVWVKLEIDGVEVCSRTPSSFKGWGIFQPGRAPLFLIRYDDDTFHYGMCATPLLTFESSFEFKIYHTYGADQGVTFEIMWALVP